jgi:hypothetical protein
VASGLTAAYGRHVTRSPSVPSVLIQRPRLVNGTRVARQAHQEPSDPPRHAPIAHAASVACQPSCTFAAASHATLHRRNKLFSSLLLQADGEAEEEQRRRGERVSSISRLLSLVRSSASPVRSWAAADRAAERGASAFCSVTNLSCDDAVFADSSCNRCCFRFETRGMFCFLGFVGY